MTKKSAAAVIDLDAPYSTVTEFRELQLAQLDLSPLNPRKHFDEARLQELAASMGNGVGVIEPLVVRPSKVHGEIFEIVAGARRFKAAALAGLATVPCTIKTLTDAQVLELMVIENDQRQDITPLEEAAGFKQLMVFGFDIDKLAARIGRSRKYIYDRVKLLDLIKPAQQLLEQGHITAGHAILIARLTPEQQEQILDVEGYNDALFEEDTAPLAPTDDDAEAIARDTDPFVGMKTRSVRELQGYIDKHFRFDAAAPVNLELYPTTVHAIEQAEKVISITREYQIHPDARDEGGGRIYTEKSWKRADGLEKSKTCDRSALGVVVVGPGRGDALRVCVKKECDVHWKAERQQREKETAGGASGEAAKREREQRDEKWKREQAERDAAHKAWLKATPQLRALALEKVKAAPAAVLINCLLTDGNRQFGPAVKALGAPKTAEAALRVFAYAVMYDLAGSQWSGPRELPALLKKFGGDVAKLLKGQPAQTSAQQSPKKKATTKPAGKKAAKKR